MRRLVRFLRVTLLLVAVVVGVLALWLHGRYGGGRPYPDLTEQPTLADDALEVAVTSPEPLGNVAVDGDGRIFYTIHPESRPEGAKLWVSENGVSRPFPALAEQEHLFQTPLGLVVDSRRRVWTIDHGVHGVGTPRLLAFDGATGAVLKDFRLSRAAAPLGSFLQDLTFDPVSGQLFVADASFFARRPAILVVDPESGAVRRLLEGHPAFQSQDWILRTASGEMKFFGGVVRLKVGLDGICAFRDGSALALGAMTHDTLYRIPIAALLDPALSATDLAATLRAIGPKPLSDGLTTDLEGGVLVTDAEHGAVVRIAADGSRRTLVRSSRIRWADDLSYGPGGWVYLADSAIPDHMLRSKRNIRERAPYFIYRFRPGIDGAPGE